KSQEWRPQKTLARPGRGLINHQIELSLASQSSHLHAATLRKRIRCSPTTSRINTKSSSTPVITCSQSEGTPASTKPFWSSRTRKTPKSVPKRFALPPSTDEPPKTAATIASKAIVPPVDVSTFRYRATYSNAANPTRNPISAYTKNFALLTATPDKRAAGSLPPTARIAVPNGNHRRISQPMK